MTLAQVDSKSILFEADQRLHTRIYESLVELIEIFWLLYRLMPPRRNMIAVDPDLKGKRRDMVADDEYSASSCR